MHEWALAEAIVTAALQVAEKEGLAKVTEVRVRVGELQQVDGEILQFAFSQLEKDKIKDAKFTVQTVPARLRCRVCGNCWMFDVEKLEKEGREAVHFIPELAHTFIKCAKCGSPDFEVLEGRGVWLESVCGEKS